MSKKYEISVVTPLHNVNLDFFKKSIEGMKSQTYGFENIQWVVVIHNCDRDYQNQVLDLLKGYDNVIAPILNNDAKTPSSPRNHGLTFATGEYVGFLDGDDRYTPECIKTALTNVKEVDADICLFRREVELEGENARVFNELVLWDQTQERIVVDKNTWDDKKIFTNVWGMVTHRLYRREFLLKNNILFDEDIPFGEDFAFNTRAFTLANKLCLLPQLIGYVYFINSGSLVQSAKTSNEKLLSYAKGIKIIIDRGLEAGIDMNDTMHVLLHSFTMFIIMGKVTDKAVRAEIKEILEPYVNMLTPIEPTKVYTEQERHDRNTIPYLILNETSTDVNDNFISRNEHVAPTSIQDFQSYVLRDIINNGQHSDYGQRYHFEGVRTMEGWSSRLPLTNYDTYQPMIQLAARVDESGIFTDNEISAYALSYGNLGTANRVPFTHKK